MRPVPRRDGALTHDPDQYEALPVPEALTAAVLAAIARGESVEVRGVLTLAVRRLEVVDRVVVKGHVAEPVTTRLEARPNPAEPAPVVLDGAALVEPLLAILERCSATWAPLGAFERGAGWVNFHPSARLRSVLHGQPPPLPTEWPEGLDDPFSTRPTFPVERYPLGADGRFVPWDRVRSFHGRAERFLPRLEALLDPTRHDEHPAALPEVLRSIEHQDSVVQCTPHVVALLQRVACCRDAVEAARAKIHRSVRDGPPLAGDPFDLGELMPPYRSDRLDEIFWEADPAADWERWQAATRAVLERPVRR